MKIDLGKIKKDILLLAEKAGVDENAIEKAYKIYRKQLEKKGIAEDNIEELTWIRVQNSLKKKALGTGNTKEEPGFFMARGNAYDGSRKARETAKKYIEENGLDAAIRANYARKNTDPNSEAQYDLLYKDFDWRMGKPIPETDWQANGLAIMKVDGEVKLCEVRFKGDAAIGPIELFKLTSIPYHMRENRKDSCDITCSKLPTEYEEEYVDLTDYAKYITAAHRDRILSNLSQIEEFILADPNGFNRWCIVEGNVIGINPIEKNNSVAVNIEDLSLKLDENLDEIPHMTVFFNDSIPIDFIDGALGVTFIVNPYFNKKNEISLSGMGYWVEEAWRGGAEEEDIDLDDVWG